MRSRPSSLPKSLITANHSWLTTDHVWVLAGDLRIGEPIV